VTQDPHPKILIVEDEWLVADAFASILSASGYEVVGPVSSILEALALAEQPQLRAALLDVNLRGEEIYPVAEALRERSVPFLFVTGYAEISIRADFREWPILCKPCRANELQQALIGLLKA
jgi:DNA-binding response OmpR family regulator